MTDENCNVDVTRGSNEGRKEPVGDSGKKFKTMKLFKNDLKGFYKPPQTLWDESFIGEAISDECHPENSSFAIGAVGGLGVGIATGFFSTSRVPLPVRTILPMSVFPKVQVLMRNSIIGSSVLWRMSKRTVLGTILYAVLECDFKDVSLELWKYKFVRKPADKWKGSILAGAVCGGIFGLRGGLPGMIMGMTMFAALPTGLEVYDRKDEIKIF